MKTIAFVKSYAYYYLGNAASRLSYFKLGKEYFFDKHFGRFGEWLGGKYQVWMGLSSDIQERANIKGPWKPATD